MPTLKVNTPLARSDAVRSDDSDSGGNDDPLCGNSASGGDDDPHCMNSSGGGDDPPCMNSDSDGGDDPLFINNDSLGCAYHTGDDYNVGYNVSYADYSVEDDSHSDYMSLVQELDAFSDTSIDENGTPIVEFIEEADAP